MAYIGNTPAEAYTSIDKQAITGDGGASYTLDHAVANENEIEVFVNNVRQEPSVAYTVSGTALTMTGNVESSDDFYVVFQGKAIQTTSHPEGQDLKARDGTFSGDISAPKFRTTDDGIETLAATDVSMSSSADGQLKIDGAGYTGAIALDATGMHLYHNSSSRALIFGTNETERMRINSSGNVGIGTTSPATAVHASGSGSTYGTFERTSAGKIIVGAATSQNEIISRDNSTGNRDLRFVTGTTERMRIDSSGNVLVGKTAASISTAGFQANSGGDTYHVASGTTAYFNRLSSNGTIAQFRKDGTTIGYVGVQGGDSFYMGNGDTGLLYASGNDAIHPWNPSTNNTRDNAIDLGRSSHRFNDLYLGGGVYLGGTGSANHLDDYEEGTWTPAVLGNTTQPTVTYSNQYGVYTKIGNRVWVHGRLTLTAISGGSGYGFINGLPFNPSMNDYSAGTVGYSTNWASNNTPTTLIIHPTANRIELYGHSGSDSRSSVADVKYVSDWTATTDIIFSATYTV